MFLSHHFRPVVFVRARSLYLSCLWLHMGEVNFRDYCQILRWHSIKSNKVHLSRELWWMNGYSTELPLIWLGCESCVGQHCFIVLLRQRHISILPGRSGKGAGWSPGNVTDVCTTFTLGLFLNHCGTSWLDVETMVIRCHDVCWAVSDTYSVQPTLICYNI